MTISCVLPHLFQIWFMNWYVFMYLATLPFLQAWVQNKASNSYFMTFNICRYIHTISQTVCNVGCSYLVGTLLRGCK